MLEQIILGIVQGVSEWLPISSSAAVYFVKVHFFAAEGTLGEVLRGILFLHLGTFLAALVYFWRDVLRLTLSAFHFRKSSPEDRSMIKFLIWTTLISGFIGWIILGALENYQGNFEVGGLVINLIIAAALFVTAWLQFRKSDGGERIASEIGVPDTLLLGVLQGFSAIPGLSRSGTTVAGLLLRKFDKELALRLSFLMSLPAVLGANIILNWGEAIFTPEALLGLAVAFIFGLLTIHLLLGLARKINFGYFVLLFAVLTLTAAFI